MTKQELEENGHEMSVIISTSARDECTTLATEQSAVDHVLKPFRAVRIRRALDTACRCTAEECAAGSADTLPQRQCTKIAIKSNRKIVFVDPCEVVVVEAAGNYVSLRHRSDSYFLRESISVMAEILKPYGFIRIHRSVLVNSLFVEQIKSRPAGAYGLRTTSGKEYTVTPTYKNNLKSLAAPGSGPTFLLINRKITINLPVELSVSLFPTLLGQRRTTFGRRVERVFLQLQFGQEPFYWGSESKQHKQADRTVIRSYEAW